MKHRVGHITHARPEAETSSIGRGYRRIDIEDQDPAGPHLAPRTKEHAGRAWQMPDGVSGAPGPAPRETRVNRHGAGDDRRTQPTVLQHPEHDAIQGVVGTAKDSSPVYGVVFRQQLDAVEAHPGSETSPEISEGSEQIPQGQPFEVIGRQPSGRHAQSDSLQAASRQGERSAQPHRERVQRSDGTVEARDQASAASAPV